jgi:hypothetical protein
MYDAINILWCLFPYYCGNLNARNSFKWVNHFTELHTFQIRFFLSFGSWRTCGRVLAGCYIMKRGIARDFLIAAIKAVKFHFVMHSCWVYITKQFQHLCFPSTFFSIAGSVTQLQFLHHIYEYMQVGKTHQIISWPCDGWWWGRIVHVRLLL